jgi:hypothetical protein
MGFRNKRRGVWFRAFGAGSPTTYAAICHYHATLNPFLHPAIRPRLPSATPHQPEPVETPAQKWDTLGMPPWTPSPR